LVHDVVMRGRVLVWIAAIVAAGGIVGLAAYLAVAGLTKASAAAGVVVAFVELVALVVGVYGVTRERRDARGGQAVTSASVGGDLTQIRGVKGKVRLRRRAPGGVPARLPTSTGEEPLPGNGQSVTGAQVAGDLDQIDDVGSDVELE
jgi:hypothetical protein